MYRKNSMDIVLGTQNKGKFFEIKEIFTHYNHNLISLSQFSGIPEIDESGSTFLENAMIKAETIYNVIKQPVLADDSGLIVYALDGRPGIHSARYGGENISFDKKISILLNELENTSEEERGAHFETAAVLFINPENIITATGICKGEIIKEKRGIHGFGFDPVFFLKNIGKTMAELTTEEKNLYSHRAIAIKNILEKNLLI